MVWRSSVATRKDVLEKRVIARIVPAKHGIGTEIGKLKHPSIASCGEVRYVEDVPYVPVRRTLLKAGQKVPIVILVHLVDDQQPFVFESMLELAHQKCVEAFAEIFKRLAKHLLRIFSNAGIHYGRKRDKIRKASRCNSVVDFVQETSSDFLVHFSEVRAFSSSEFVGVESNRGRYVGEIVVLDLCHGLREPAHLALVHGHTCKNETPLIIPHAWIA